MRHFIIFTVTLISLFSSDFTKAETNFTFSNFEKTEDLEKKLNEIFPLKQKQLFENDLSTLDALFVDQGNAYRSINLIKDHRTQKLRKGTSTAENFVYYYSPTTKSGENGWEGTHSGWVIKIKYVEQDDGDFISFSDETVATKASENSILQAIDILSSPNDEADNEHIKYVKELLQYEIDLNQKSPFKQQEWDDLVLEHKSSSCLNNFTQSCLLDQLLSLINYKDGKRRFTHLQFLADVAIQYGDEQSARKLLSYWPSRDDVRAYENTIPEIRKNTPEEIEKITDKFHTQYLQLLFLAGQYDLAKEKLSAFQEEQKSGNDYGAISVLIKRGDLGKASELSQITLDWSREVPDPNENSSAIMHCRNYFSPTTRPVGMGELATAYVENGELENAYNISQLIRTYAENNAYGQKSHCYMSFAKSAYTNAMEALIQRYSEQGNTSKTNALFDELFSFFKNTTPKVETYNWKTFTKIAEIAYENNLLDTLPQIAEYIKEHDEIEFRQGSGAYEYDPISYTLALSGNSDKAISALENFKIKPLKKSKGVFAFEPAKASDIKLTTYLKIVDTLVKYGQNDEALTYIEKLKPYIGKRQTKYNREKDNIGDLIGLAQNLHEAGEIDASRKLLDSLLNTKIKNAPIGEIARLYAKHAHISDVLEWSRSYPLYGGWAYSRIAKNLIEQERFEELDIFLKEMALALSTDTQSVVNWEHASYALLDRGDYQRYTDFISMLDHVSESALERRSENEKKRKKSNEAFRKKNNGGTNDTSEQIWLMKKLLGHAMMKQNVSDEILKDTWSKYVENCRSQYYLIPKYDHHLNIEPNAHEIMGACYLGVVREPSEYQSYQARN